MSMQYQEHPKHPGFYAIRIPISEWLNPLLEREGERIINSDGHVITFPSAPYAYVTVLRRMPNEACAGRLVQDGCMEAAMSANEIWQEVQCSQGDHDRFGNDLLILGQRFHCHLCGSEHAANPESVTTMMEIEGVMSYPDLPETAGQLEALRASVTL